jgi:uroporphyrin-III C-methyltransferase/precorrin-2 dehydrogenase/sirohydrochlorin ferrochelatase
MPSLSPNPKVIIAGAGPGDAGLITVKAVKYLQQASYILTDRLVNPEIIRQYASPKAEIIYVGKHGGLESTSQESINRLLVEYGKKVGLTVRLKGGDVAFFAQVIAEIDALNEAKIPFEIVPGITSASGASASLRVPLTARGYSQGVRFLTYYDGEIFSGTDWQNLADTTDTLVFYMTSKSLPELVKNLSRFSGRDKPLAIIEQATTPQQRVITSSLSRYQEELANVAINQPAIVIIGDVLNLYEGTSELIQQTVSFFKEH